MRYLTHITVLALALMIGVTSVQLAAARGQAPAVGTMEICTGTGAIHILVDENGEPTGGVMICPDYAMAFFADVWVVPPAALRVDAWQEVWVGQGDVAAQHLIRVETQARGPPLSV
jgi:hypothetical protein